jgi:hypothetical protein
VPRSLVSPQCALDRLHHRAELGALGIRLDEVNHPSQDHPLVRVEVAWRALLHRDEYVARQLMRRWRPEKQPLMHAGNAVLPFGAGETAVCGILSVFGFILSGPGLDGVGDPVMKYRWL